MSRKRRVFGPAFKAKVALAAVRGDKTTCPFREPHLLSAGVVGQAGAISISEVVYGEQAAGC